MRTPDVVSSVMALSLRRNRAADYHAARQVRVSGDGIGMSLFGYLEIGLRLLQVSFGASLASRIDFKLQLFELVLDDILDRGENGLGLYNCTHGGDPYSM
jgi:hypothetical protein